MERDAMQHQRDKQPRMGGLYRRFQREAVRGFSCDIADGHRLHGGVVADVSQHGFKLCQVSSGFKGVAHCYATVISGGGGHFKVLAKPCWKKQTEDGLEVGFKILDSSWEWTELILALVESEEAGHA